jgi:hypothetical protein
MACNGIALPVTSQAVYEKIDVMWLHICVTLNRYKDHKDVLIAF